MIEIRLTERTAVTQNYDEIYRHERMYRNPDSMYRWLVGLLRPKPGRRILDVACGNGRLLSYAQRAGLEVHGIDIAAEAIHTAAAIAPGAHLQVASGEAIPYADNFFDYVTCIGSLEHYESPERGVAEIARVLRPGGITCVLVPNTFGLLWNIASVMRTGDIAVDVQPVQRYATRVQWQRLLEHNGLRVRHTTGYHLKPPLSAADWRWFLSKPQRFLALAASYTIPLNLASTLIYLCSTHDTVARDI